jgi:hypothetical protein
MEFGLLAVSIADAIVEAEELQETAPSRQLSLAITKLEEALLWLQATEEWKERQREKAGKER